MLTPLHGREGHLAALRRVLRDAEPALVVVWGRRRVGKTRLLLEAARGGPAVHYQAASLDPGMSLALFRAEVERVAGPDPALDSLDDWPGLVAYLGRLARDRLPGLTVVLDDFPCLCDGDPSLPAALAVGWAAIRAAGHPLKLVLCGSRIAFMEGLAGEDGVLEGFAPRALELEPLSFREAARFFPGWTPEDRLRAYGVFGGIPYYLARCDPSATLAENVLELVLRPDAPLADEPARLLQAELRDVTRYATILLAVAEGCATTGDIVARARDLRDASALSPYVRKLAELRLIRIDRSLDATARERDRRYRLDDPFLAFWYRFHLPNASRLAAGHGAEVLKRAIAPRFDAYMGGVFEGVCRDYLRLCARESLPAPARTVGRLWGGDHEIAVAGRLLDGTAVAGDCAWDRAPAGVVALARLRERVAATPYYAGDAGADPYLLLFSRSGFTADLEAEADGNRRVRLLGPGELLLG